MTEEEAQAFVRASAGSDSQAYEKLERLCVLLAEENARQNLVADSTLAMVWNRHIADSAQLLGYVPRETSPWLDLGSGAGFPGLAIACLRPAINVVLVESRTKRIDWLRRIIDALELPNARVFGRRLEAMTADTFAVISARAFASLAQTVAAAARFSTAETVWLLPKGRSAGQELEALAGWHHTFHVEQSITDPYAGIIVGKVLGREG